MRTPKSLDDNIIYQIAEAAKSAHKSVSEVFVRNKFDVTVEQFGILALLWYKDGINQQDIANGLNRDKTTIARVVENMVKHKLVLKITDQMDRRNNLISLTKKGKSLQKQMVESSGQVYIKAVKDIPNKDIDKCLEVLVKIQSNLQ